MSLPIVYSPHYATPLPPQHRFPMPKFRRIYELLLADGIARPDQFHAVDAAPLALLEQVHTPAYVAAFCAGTLESQALRRIGLPWSSQLVQRTRTAVAGTLLTARLALTHGLACNTAGGTHHAFAAYGSGFCIFNDLAVTARTLRQEGSVRSVLIVDLDVHQGDGTAALFQQDPSVFTFSIHCAQNFPFHKQQSDLDLALEAGCGDDDYLRALGLHLPPLLRQLRPDLVLYDAGVDPHAADRLGKLALTDQGLYRRDLAVLESCATLGHPVACVVGGGYSDDITGLARRHCLLHRAANTVWERLGM